MEFFLNKVSQQAMTFAIRSGIAVTSQFAIKQCARYIRAISGKDKKELLALQERLQGKIRIISPAIDLVEIIAARGNTSLESALELTKELRHEIEQLGIKLQAMMDAPKQNVDAAKEVMGDIRNLLSKIEEAVPFISLAVATSGVKISMSMPPNVSPTKLLQASTFVSTGDTAYAHNPFLPAQIGNSLTLSLYMLFASHSHRAEHVSAADLTWQEVIYKCDVKLQRVPLVYDDETPGNLYMKARTKAEEYCYELCLTEDLDDGRVHERKGIQYEGVRNAGIKIRLPIHEIGQIFYTTSGKLLGIQESTSPVLLVKRNKDAPPPRRLTDRAARYDFGDDDEEYSDEDAASNTDSLALELAAPHANSPYADEIPPHLDPEWLAFELFTNPNDDGDDGDDTLSNGGSSATLSPASSRASSPAPPSSPPIPDLSHLSLASPPTPALPNLPSPNRGPASSPSSINNYNRALTAPQQNSLSAARNAAIKSDLSLLECLLRLTKLQNHQQASHLTVSDEMLNLFLNDALWEGSKEQRTLERERARGKIGFDPYEATPKGLGSGGSGSARKLGIKGNGSGTPRGGAGGRSRDGTPLRGSSSGGVDSVILGVSSPTPRTPGGDVERLARREREEWTPEKQLGGANWADSPVRRS